jgi:ABC-2 type transport system ATP-binding protein
VTGSVIAVDGLSKKYGSNIWALQQVSVEIPESSLVALVGPNGAGKSTLIRILVGFDRPTDGRVTVMGIDPHRRPNETLEQIGYVPQQSSLYRRLTVEDHLALAAGFRRLFDARLAKARLRDYGVSMTATVARLSGGQQAQLSIALALGCRASVLLLDEPLASLDPLARSELVDSLSQEARSGRTVLVSSHIVADLASAVGRLLLLSSGRVLLEGRVKDLLAAHALTSLDRRPDGGDIVATLPSADGPGLAVIRASEAPSGPTTSRPNLEQLVVAYLRAARRQPSRP